MTDAETTDYVEYPITLVHPHFRPASSTEIAGSKVVSADGRQLLPPSYQGTAEQHPPVTANNADQEAYFLAQGYTRAGHVDPSAWVRAHSSPAPDNYKPQKYPMWKDGVLIMSAAEDPDATAEDLMPEPEPVQAAEPAAPAANLQEASLRAMLEQMNVTLKQVSDQLAESRAEARELRQKLADQQAASDQSGGVQGEAAGVNRAAATAPAKAPAKRRGGRRKAA